MITNEYSGNPSRVGAPRLQPELGYPGELVVQVWRYDEETQRRQRVVTYVYTGVRMDPDKLDHLDDQLHRLLESSSPEGISQVGLGIEELRSSKTRENRDIDSWNPPVTEAVAAPESRPGERPIEEILSELASEVPKHVWDQLPSDLIDNLDEYLYGQGSS